MPTDKPTLGELVTEAGAENGGIGKLALHINDLGNKMDGLEKSVSDISIEISAVKTDFRDALQRIADQVVSATEKASSDAREREKALVESFEKDLSRFKKDVLKLEQFKERSDEVGAAGRLDKLEQFKDRMIEGQASAFAKYAPIGISVLTMLGGIAGFVLMYIRP